VARFNQSADVLAKIENGEEPILAIKSPLFRHLSRATIFRWIMSGKLPAVRMGRQFFTVPSAVRESLLAGALEDPVAKVPKKGTASPSDHAAAVARLEARFGKRKPMKVGAGNGGAT
jgi:hypothetical protein